MIRKIETNEDPHQSDVMRIKRLLLEKGYDCDFSSAAGIWYEHSDRYAAGWLGLPETDSELWNLISSIVESEANVDMTVDAVKRRVSIGYTISVYGTQQNIRKQMLKDINFLLQVATRKQNF